MFAVAVLEGYAPAETFPANHLGRCRSRSHFLVRTSGHFAPKYMAAWLECQPAADHNVDYAG